MEEPDPSTITNPEMRSRKRGLPLPNFARPIESNSYQKRRRRQQEGLNDKKDAPADKKKAPPPPQEPRQSRIAGVLPYQSFRQYWDPSLPKHYTRRELRTMNDETPDRGEEESPLFRQSPEKKRETSPSFSDPQQPPECYPPQALFVGTEDEGHPGTLATQKFSDLLNHHDNQSHSSSTVAEASGNANHPEEPSHPECDAIPQMNDVIDKEAATSKDATTGTKQSTDTSVQPYDSKPAQEQFRLFFVERGRDMHADILVGPKTNASARGAKVLEQFDRHAKDPLAIPTHLVVGNVSSPDVVCRALGFESVEELRHYMHNHTIQCATKAWAAKVSTEPYQQPRRAFILHQIGVPYLELYTPLTPLAPSRPTVAEARPSRRINRQAVAKAEQRPTHNVALSNIFKRLSKAYQEAPLDPIDTWRAYSFQTAATRLQALPFEVDNQNALQRVKNIRGFGSSIMAILQEFVQQKEEGDEEEAIDTGNEDSITIRRLENVKTDPQRQALRTMMNIWGVGRVKALELVKAGYMSIDEIRKDFDQNCLRVSLHRNQYIGLLCYDDIMEEMDRAEVEHIGAIIQKAIHEDYPQAEVQIMGSYRRGNESCGDIDVLIVHRKFQEKVNPKALGRVIDRLRVRGHIAYNLTQLPGMDTEAFETLPRDVARRLGRPSILQPQRGKDACSSYMGIFNSPVHPGKVRRCDLKWYPYRERFYASLYFTGNGFFNRSMRLWARRKFGYTLSDHGLFQDSSDRVRVFDALSEFVIFSRLGLVWKEPTERDGFDAVIGIDSKRATDLEAWSSEEFRREEGDHAWIK